MQYEDSPAHLRSAGSIIDPAYSIRTLSPAPLPPSFWLYPRAVYESALLHLMRRDTIRARLIVGYDLSRIPSAPDVLFYRKNFPAGKVAFRTAASCKVFLDQEETPFLTRDAAAEISFVLDRPALVTVRVDSANPVFRIPALASELPGWECACSGGQGLPHVWGAAEYGGPPEGFELPSLLIPLRKAEGNLYDAGCELFGTAEIHCAERPGFGLGESVAEAENRDPMHMEQSCTLYAETPGVWKTPELCAFRYLRVESAEPCEVFCRAVFTPERYRGAFAADPELNAIWMNAAYTLRLCIDFFILDGIKRDRLPWMGDHLISMLSDAYSFHDGDVCRRTLTLLGHPGVRHGDINGIADYTLWLPVASEHFQLYWGDRAFLEKQYPELADTADALLERAGDTVWLPEHETIFFIDWTKEEKFTGVQVLFHYALLSSARLARRMNDTDRERKLLAHAGKLRAKLYAEAFDAERKLFRAHPGRPEEGFNRYANILAVLSGLADGENARSAAQALLTDEMPAVGTPYMNALECLALYRAGFAAEALERIRRIWGGMLREGATTFWEGFDPRHEGLEHYAFYDRPFGKSLCHAWASGPVFLLPLFLFGVEPLEDGWKTFRISPASGLLREGDCATLPVPGGDIRLLWRNGKLEIQKPSGMVLAETSFC